MRYLVTGGAGFIGSHLAEALLARGDQVICVDNFNDYYDPQRKRRNIAPALGREGYTLVEADIRDDAAMERLFERHRPERIAHIAAMAGPRPSMQHPLLYEAVNVRGTLVLLDLAGRYGASGFVLASTSSVYGRAPTPWSEETPTDRPLSPYAATKKAAEALAYALHNQYGTPTRVVRFFTVYGPRGRPDMTPYLFVDAMVAGRPITLFEGGVGVYRDWTYVDDIVAGVLAALDSDLPFEVFNLGNARPMELLAFVRLLESVTGLRATIERRPLPPADPPATFAEIGKARRLLGFEPRTPLETGLARFWEWYQADVLDGPA
jgi:UDP-glucuronate 4-epimerase